MPRSRRSRDPPAATPERTLAAAPECPLAAAPACALAAALVGACLPGADPCFVPQSIVTDLRILGVRADPPEALVDLDQGQVPALAVRALAAGTELVNATTLRLAGLLCVPTDDGRCPGGSLALQGPVAAAHLQEATLQVEVPAALVAAARDADPLRGYGGVRVLLDLELVTDSGSARASKLLLFSPRATTPRPNRPIEIASLDLTVQGTPFGPLRPAGAEQLIVGTSYGLRPRLAPLPDGSPALEEYDTVDLSGRAVHLREQVDYSFYTTRTFLFGDLRGAGQAPQGVYLQGADVASEPPAGVADPPDGLVRITPVAGGNGTLWVVARDSRGAQAWAAFTLQGYDQRTCGPGAGGCAQLFFGCL